MTSGKVQVEARKTREVQHHNRVQGRCGSLWIPGDLCPPTTNIVRATNIDNFGHYFIIPYHYPKKPTVAQRNCKFF